MMGGILHLTGAAMNGFYAQQQYEEMMRHRRSRGDALWRPGRDRKVADALKLLGLDSIGKPETIRAAFKRKLVAIHTDTGGSGGDADALKSARDLLLKHVNQETPGDDSETCPMCKGRGSVAAGFASEPCSTCNGKGRVDADR